LPDVLAVKRLEPTGYIIWEVSTSGIRTKLDPYLDRDPLCKAAMAQARDTLLPVVTGITSIFPGRLGFVVYTPIVV